MEIFIYLQHFWLAGFILFLQSSTVFVWLHVKLWSLKKGDIVSVFTRFHSSGPPSLALATGIPLNPPPIPAASV